MKFDTLSRNALIIDGRNTLAYFADIGLHDGLIAGIGDLADARAQQVIEAAGRVLAPGFIDVHTHDDTPGYWGTSVATWGCSRCTPPCTK